MQLSDNITKIDEELANYITTFDDNTQNYICKKLISLCNKIINQNILKEKTIIIKQYLKNLTKNSDILKLIENTLVEQYELKSLDYHVYTSVAISFGNFTIYRFYNGDNVGDGYITITIKSVKYDINDNIIEEEYDIKYDSCNLDPIKQLHQYYSYIPYKDFENFILDIYRDFRF